MFQKQLLELVIVSVLKILSAHLNWSNGLPFYTQIENNTTYMTLQLFRFIVGSRQLCTADLCSPVRTPMFHD